MISYRPLRIYCLDKKLKLTNIISNCHLSKNIVTKINNDENIELLSLAKICLHLGITLDQAVEISGGKDGGG